MTEFSLYIILTILVVGFLNINMGWARSQPQISKENLLIVERLAARASKQKDYRRKPENYTSFGYNIRGHMEQETATMEYRFPLLDGKESRFAFQMETLSFSSTINQFGVHTSCFGLHDNDTFSLKTTDENYLLEHMNKDGFFFRSFNEGEYGLDYNHVIDISSDLCSKVAHFIALELQNRNRDSYINRVQAVLNFVQYIPYGIPNFDCNEDCYFGLALPHESVAISYSDCDSKSALFAGILRQLITHKNIVLVSCQIEKENHMVVGVSDLPFAGQSVAHNGKEFLLLETTTPIPINNQKENRFKNIEIISLRSA
jgi:hypothetical protein